MLNLELLARRFGNPGEGPLAESRAVPYRAVLAARHGVRVRYGVTGRSGVLAWVCRTSSLRNTKRTSTDSP